MMVRNALHSLKKFISKYKITIGVSAGTTILIRLILEKLI